MLQAFRLILSARYNYQRLWMLFNNVTVTSHPQKTNFDQQHFDKPSNDSKTLKYREKLTLKLDKKPYVKEINRT
jgi:hypothetical protein